MDHPDIDQALADFIENLVPTFEKSLSGVVNDPIKSLYSQFGFQCLSYLVNVIDSIPIENVMGKISLKADIVCVYTKKELGAFESASSSFLGSGRKLS